MTEETEVGRKFRVSFSQWEMYNECPSRWYYKNVQKLPASPPGPAATRGLELHDRVENYINGVYEDVIPRPMYLEKFLAENPKLKWDSRRGMAEVADKYMEVLDQYRNHPNGNRFTEKRLAFDREFFLCGAQGQHAFLIAVLDAVRCGGHWQGEYAGTEDGIVRVAEWKSGKPKPTHAEQRKMYAMFALRAWLPTERVEVTTYYLEDPNEKPQRLTVAPSAEDKLKALWKGRFDQMEQDKICAPRPGQHCTWCDYSRLKGGPCKVG